MKPSGAVGPGKKKKKGDGEFLGVISRPPFRARKGQSAPPVVRAHEVGVRGAGSWEARFQPHESWAPVRAGFALTGDVSDFQVVYF